MKTTRRLFALVLSCVSIIFSFVLPASAAEVEKNVKITYSDQVVDSLNGVDAKYIPGTGNSNTGTYCCAQYVKNYYKKVFGVTVSNLLSNCTPVTSEKGYAFKQITSGIAVGDVVRLPGHWAIVKDVSGNRLTLIEQNWKWQTSGGTYCKINRNVTLGSTNGLVIFRLYKDGKSVNGAYASPRVVYESHLANIGWTPAVTNGSMSGTTGQSRNMEAIKISLENISGGISYRAHVQDIGWMSPVQNGSIAGTEGRSLRLEAICIQLTGQAAQEYSVWYRVHVQNIGWMSWCRDGSIAGTEGRSLSIEAIEIKLIAK